MSCKRFRENEVRLQLHAPLYNLATFLRCIELPEVMADWSLSSLQLKRTMMGIRVVRHSRAITFRLAEVAVTPWSGPSSLRSTTFEPLRHVYDRGPVLKLNASDTTDLSTALKNGAAEPE